MPSFFTDAVDRYQLFIWRLAASIVGVATSAGAYITAHYTTFAAYAVGVRVIIFSICASGVIAYFAPGDSRVRLHPALIPATYFGAVFISYITIHLIVSIT